MNNIPNGQSTATAPSATGTTAHEIRASVNPKIGAIMYITVLECVGIIVSFANNLTPSAIGWNKPPNPTTVGPFLN